MLPQCRNCLGVMQVAGNDVDDVVLLAELAQLLRADCHNDLMIKHKKELCARILLRHAANALKILRIVIGLCQRNAVELLQKSAVAVRILRRNTDLDGVTAALNVTSGHFNAFFNGRVAKGEITNGFDAHAHTSFQEFAACSRSASSASIAGSSSQRFIRQLPTNAPEAPACFASKRLAPQVMPAVA